MASLVIKKILETKKITDYLNKKHVYPDSDSGGKMKYHCPLHEGDNTPSFYVYTESGEYENFYCFGCLEEREMVWTFNGLIPIGEIKPGDQIYDVSGRLQTVMCTEKKVAPTLAIQLGSYRDSLILTGDHTCVTMRREVALKAYRQLYHDSPNDRVLMRPDLRSRPRYGEPVLEYAAADSLKVGDYFVFPVNPMRNVTWLSDESILKKYTKGLRTRRIPHLTSEKGGAWLCGIYLAEGSSGERVVRFTLNIGETAIAERIADLMRDLYGVKTKITPRPDRSTLDVHVCNVDLAAHFTHVFGKGACKKKVPGMIFRWPQDRQLEFLDGYREGDGSKRSGATVTCSKEVATAIYGISVQAGLRPCFRSPVAAKVDKDGVSHSEWYTVSVYTKDRANGFFEHVGGVLYYFSPITKIDVGERARVVDISVTGSETFCCKMGATHNCKASYNIIHLYRDLEKVSLGEAIRALADGLEIDINAELSSAVSDIEADLNTAKDFSPADLSLLIANQLYNFTKMVENDPDCVAQVDKMSQVVDKAFERGDIKTLKGISESLTDVLRRRYGMYLEEQERRIMQAAKTAER